MILFREIDMDSDGHLVIDKWLYIVFDRSVTFSTICLVRYDK